MKPSMFPLALVLVATPSFAAPGVVHECKPNLDSIGNLVEPVKSFANGEIRVAHVSTEEPAAAPEHLLIFVSPLVGMGADCFAISASKYPDSEDSYRGYYALEFDKLHASYDDRKGLLLRIPASIGDGGEQKPVGDLKIRINRKNDNSVTVEQ
jgi:hypothetical protein